MPKISACIISFNEEKKIEDCLKSLDGVVDEIIVVDSFSSDKTVEIAKRYTDKIVYQKFLGYIEQKNFAIGHSNNEWILILDCDERLSEPLIDSIRDIKDDLDKFDAYSMARKTFYVYRWLNYCWYPDKKVRLFNKQMAKVGGIDPHDRIKVRSHKIKTLSGDILHYSFDSISAHIQTIDKFTDTAASEIIKRNKSVNIFSPLTHASWIFIKIYIFKRGFLDGLAGLVVAVLSFMHVFVKYCKVLFLRRQN